MTAFLFPIVLPNFDNMRKRSKILLVFMCLILLALTITLSIKGFRSNRYDFENHSEIPKNN